MKSIFIGETPIGPGHPCFVIAEAGVNHNGDVDMAHRLIDVAADAKVDAIKFQTFDPEKLASPDAPMAEYQAENLGETGSQLDMLRGLVLPKSCYPALIQHASDRGLIFLSTPFEDESADFLEEMKVPAFKVSSGDLTNHPFLVKLASTGRPLMLSTGMATMAQVEGAVNAVEATGNPPLLLFHCVTNYPADAGDCNLRAIDTLKAQFGRPVGWSDHTTGFDISIAAVAMGACALEKHFTLDRNLPGPDHVASLEGPELAAMVAAIRRVESAMGDGRKQPRLCEVEISIAARKSLHWKKEVKVGSTVQTSDLTALRPGTGISPENVSMYLGRVLARDVRQNQIVTELDFAIAQ